MAHKQYANKRDVNESQIIKDLEGYGASVIQLNAFDMVVGYKGVTHMIEIKNPEQDWSITPKQRKIINNWVGSPLHIITTSEQAFNIIDPYRHELDRK